MDKHFHSLLQKHIEKRGFSFYSLSEYVDIPETKYSTWKKPKEKGGRRPTDRDIRKLAAFNQLELTESLLKGWRILDEYSAEEIEIAHKLVSEEINQH
jgi:hypothetical protein